MNYKFLRIIIFFTILLAFFGFSFATEKEEEGWFKKTKNLFFKIWEEKINPFFKKISHWLRENILEKAKSIFEKEVKERKLIAKEELKKEREELKEELKNKEFSFSERIKNFIGNLKEKYLQKLKFRN